MLRAIRSRESRMRQIRTYGLTRERAPHWTLSTLLQKTDAPISSRLQVLSILYKFFFAFGRKSLFLEEAVRLRTFAVAEQHDLRTIRPETEILEVRSQHGAIPLASNAFIDNEMLDQRIRLVAMHRIRA